MRLADERTNSARCRLTCFPQLVIHEPVELTDEDEFIVVGCDGVWDVLSDEEAVRIVRADVAADCALAAAKLRDAAYLAGSDDNISVLVVDVRKRQCRDNL